jgi:imidazolonepropionase-like amidohydrolase
MPLHTADRLVTIEMLLCAVEIFFILRFRLRMGLRSGPFLFPMAIFMDMKSSCTFAFLLLLFSGCRPDSDQTTFAIRGATLMDGTSRPPIFNSVMIIRAGHVVAVGTSDDIDIPTDAEVMDASGKFIVPGLINAHGHVGDVKGIEGGHYSRENVIDNLTIYAKYGITTVVSLGGDREEGVALRAAIDSTATGRARLFIAGSVIAGPTPEQAISQVEANHLMGVDFMKIRVDDNLGTAEKMKPHVYEPVIQRSHELGYMIATHMYYLDDAKRLLRAGSDLLAHSVRDQAVDEELISLLKERKVCYCPTLTREISTFVYGDTALFFSDPFFTRVYGDSIIQPLLDPSRQAQVKKSKSAVTYQQQLPTAMANLKKLADEGIPIAFGTDSGVPTRFMGYFEHLELGMMQDAGVKPRQILESATGKAASCLGLNRVGTLVQGNWADFLILDADPFIDIRNLREISATYIGGVALRE